jgi:hypothetical protein
VDIVTSTLDISIAYPPGWVQLPVTTSTKIEHDPDLEIWAKEKAARLVAQDGMPDAIAQRARELTQLTITCRARKDRYGFAFYPPDAGGLAAILDVQVLTPSRKHKQITFPLLEENYASYTQQTVGDIESARPDLPSGPALRVRRKQIEEPDEQGQGPLTESVTYAIHPPGFTDGVVMIMTWTSIGAGDELAAMADAIARTIRVR